MNILIDALPETVIIGGAEWPIETNFRTSILFELMIQDDTLTNAEKIQQALRLYYPKMPGIEHMVEAMNQVIWFYSCGNPPKEKKRYKATQKGAESEDEDEDDEEEMLKSNGQRLYSYEYDAPYIYAAYLEQYGIDLADIEYLHWWKFKAMFRALNDDVKISKIMGYRGMDISEKMSAEQKRYYRRMKKLYELPLSEAEQENQDAIVEALLSGKTLTGLI